MFLSFSSFDELLSEIESNLGRGRAFVPLEEGEEMPQPGSCELVLVHPLSGEWMQLPAEIVYIAQEPVPCVGLQLSQSSEDLDRALSHFIASTSESTGSYLPPAGGGAIAEETPGFFEEALQPGPSDFVLESIPPLSHAPSSILPATTAPSSILPATSAPSSIPPASDDDLGWVESEGNDDEQWFGDDAALDEVDEEAMSPSQRQSHDERRLALSPAERVRSLDAAGRDKVARRGQLADRVALERAYGPAVWEALLSNPLLSAAEVSRIAKNGNITQPILHIIVSNSAWLARAEVRRALLSNPRLNEGHAERVLRALPSHELKLVPRQGAYPGRVRNIAKKMLG